MIVTCPSCSKRYMLDGTGIGAEGRQVRCASCHHVWRHIPDEISTVRPLPFLAFPPGESVVDSLSFTKKRSSWVKWVGLAFPLLFIGCFIFGRQEVVILWPSSRQIYALLGLSSHLPGEGLVISNPTSFTHKEGNTEMLVVAGDILNTSAHVQTIPVLKITLTGATPLGNPGQEGPILDHWEHRLAEYSLLPGESLHFEAAPRPKAEGAHHVSIEF